MDESLQNISRSNRGGHIYPNDSLERLHAEVNTQSAALQLHVENMQNNIFDLADLLSKTKRDADKHALRTKIWGWLVKVFKAISTTLKFGAVITPLLDPAATLAEPVMDGISKLASYIALACREMEKRSCTFLNGHSS